MWLINIKSMSLEEFTPPDLPSYAILSHTWEDGEVTFQEFSNLGLAKKKAGFVKIKKTCELAAVKKIRYVWVDTCCIDKSSSAELSEAINSMFEWYKLSTVCFAYLSDLSVNHSIKRLPTLWRDERNQRVCRWFRRGWTLQELLAPAKLEFYDCGWNFRGLKTDLFVMRQLVPMTGIENLKVFENSNAIWEVAVGERMSWASTRQTKRLEDIAYCLLGIFQVNMPMLYGEGMRAFQRLQEEIIKTSTDMSLFCWRAKYDEPKYRGLLAHSPVEFASYYDTTLRSRNAIISRTSVGEEKEYSVTNKGIRIDAELLRVEWGGRSLTALKCYVRPDDHVVLIPIRHYRDDVYVREGPDSVLFSDSAETQNKLIYIAKDVNGKMSQDLADNMNPRLSFVVSPLPARFRLRPVRGWPTERWRHLVECYQHTSAVISTCIAVYQLTNEGQEVGEFAAICQKSSSPVQLLRYALVAMRDIKGILKKLEGSEDERKVALGTIEKRIIARQQTVEVEFESTSIYLFISKYSPNNEQRQDTLYISLTSIDDLNPFKRTYGRRAERSNETGPSEGIKRSKNLGDVDS